MLDVIDGYSESELEDIGNDSLDGDVGIARPRRTRRSTKFEADLAAC